MSAVMGMGDLLGDALPEDDAGAETLDRYEWQAMMATVDLLGLVRDAVLVGRELPEVTDWGLVCEYHEDWARVVGDDVQLVSGKHKEPQFGAFTTCTSLLAEGGLYHLFDRWLALGEIPGCRIVTSAGLAGDASAARDAGVHFREHGPLANLPTQALQAAFDRLCTGIATMRRQAGRDELDDLATNILPRFLSCLEIDSGRARRDHLPTMAPTAYADPVAEALGRPGCGVEVWEAVLSLVRARMRAAGPAQAGHLPTLIQQGNPLERRSVSVADAYLAVRSAARSPSAYAPLPRPLATNRMAVKMMEGGCAATSIARAERLRRRFVEQQRSRRSTPGSAEAELDLDLLLRRVADHVTAETRLFNGERWGASMWAQLESRLRDESGQGPALGLDADMLLGGVSDLANKCFVWFSEPFDARARLQELREGRS